VRMSSLDLQYVPAEVTLRDSGLAVNVSTDTVQMAFPATEVAPAGGDWKTATWETDATATPSRYLSRCLVGPGGTVTLAAGLYDVWVKITHSPELAVLQATNPDGSFAKLEVY
jgi:hypothetical protein